MPLRMRTACTRMVQEGNTTLISNLNGMCVARALQGGILLQYGNATHTAHLYYGRSGMDTSQEAASARPI
jgi:hypothetical protein